MSTTERPAPRRRAPAPPIDEGDPDPSVDNLQPPDAKRGLHAKLAEVMELVQRIEKRGHNSEQHYDFATAEDISDEIRSKLGSRGVTITPRIDTAGIQMIETGQTTQKGRKWITWWVPITYTFTDAATAETLEVPWLGVADDYSDKGFPKALTAGMKFMLRSVFLISTGDDPEEDRSAAGVIAPAAEAIQSARDHRTTPAARPRERESNLDELLTQENRRAIIGLALGAGVRMESGKLDDVLLRQLVSAVSGGEVRKISEMTVGIGSKMKTVLKRMKDDPDTERANVEAYFSEHPDHLPIVETAPPEPEPDEPEQPQLPAADDDDGIPF
jgi:hypothetical protein